MAALSIHRVLGRSSASLLSQWRPASQTAVGKEDFALVLRQAKSILKQKIAIIDILRPEDYSRKDPAIYSSSVGGHLRHALDHFQAVVTAASKPEKERIADYDTRARNTLIETDKAAARECVEHLLQQLDQLDGDLPIDAVFIGETQTFASYRIPSLVARELSFASHHSVHHLSLVKLLLQGMRYELPDEAKDLGLAASTVKDIQERPR